MTGQIKIGIVGLWHLGAVLCAAWSKLGFEVIGFDYSKSLINSLGLNQPPIFEPHLQETLANSKEENRLMFADEIALLSDCDFVFLAYDTPLLDDDSSNLIPLEKAIEDLGNVLKDHALVIVSSQTPVGTCGNFRSSLQAKNHTVELAYSPENLRLGQAIECYLKPGRIIIGADTSAAESKAVSLFGNIEAELVTMSLASAEMVKHGINAFLANSIVFANHLADLCEACGANILDVVKGVKSDDRIGLKAYLSAGIGFSGGTLGRDLKILAELNRKTRQKAFLYESLQRFNSERKDIILDKVTRLLDGKLSGKTIGVLGLTYKPGTSTLRRSLPIEIIKSLVNKGAKVKAYDPKADYDELEGERVFKICTSIDDAISESDLVLLLTEWSEFREYNWENGLNLMKNNRLFDAKNSLVDMELSEKGYRYSGIGFANI